MPSVVCRTVNLATGEVESSRAMKLNKDGLEWFVRNLTWAIHHGRGIQVFNVDDEAKADKA